MTEKRFQEPDPSVTNAEQRAFIDELMAARNRLPGPYRIWWKSLGLAKAVERLEHYVRFESPMSNRLKELAILITVRFWRAEYAWQSHAAAGRKAGVHEEVIAALRDRRTPSFTEEDEAAVYAFCMENLEKRAVSDATWRRVEAAVGAQGAIDLIGIMGVYTLVGLTLNTYQVPPAGGAAPELKD